MAGLLFILGENMGYIYGFDLSLSSTGISIFSNDAKLVFLTSVDTKSEKTHQMKLKKIADEMLRLKKIYPPEKVIIERGFYRFPKSTEACYKVLGLCQYVFYDIEQILYAPMTIKKMVGGKGNMLKIEIYDIVKKLFPEIIINNLDESDALSVCLCYFRKNGIYND